MSLISKPLRRIACEMDDGARIWLRQHGNREGPRLWVGHGNGFATDGYAPFWSHFLERYEVVVYDQRNHGQNPRHDLRAHSFRRFAKDLAHLLEHATNAFGEKPQGAVFHSLSAITAILHALEAPWPWRALVLVDPPLCPEPDHPLYSQSREEESGLAERAAKRRDHFSSPEKLAEKFAKAMGEAPWAAGAYKGMAEAVLRPSDQREGFLLACPGAYEAKIFSENSSLKLTPRLVELEGPTLFLCGDPELSSAQMPARVNASLRGAHGHPYHALPGGSHMLQLEQPALAAQVALEFLGAEGL